MTRHVWKISVLALAITASTALSDTIRVDTLLYEGTINGIRNGKLSVSLKAGTEIFIDLNQIISIDLDATAKMAEAEQVRGEDAKKAAALYKQAIAAINKPDLKLLAEWRAIEPTDKDGRWAEALALFLDVYQASPTETVWKGRPMHWPETGSKLFADGIEKLNAAIKAAKTDEVRKNLKSYLVDIYLKDGDADAAARLAKELQTGIAEAPVTAAAPGPQRTGADDLLEKKDYGGALAAAQKMLAEGAAGEAAVRLFAVEAQAEEGLGKADDAAAAWLRIPAHYPSSVSAPVALARAAELEYKENRPEAARALQKEILEAYPESPQAAGLKK